LAQNVFFDNGSWIRTLKRPNVEAVRTRIDRIASEGVVTMDGRLRPLDVLIYGTGFQSYISDRPPSFGAATAMARVMLGFDINGRH
jgi:cation diffusion facilitator CzcD-associated flavoprotein CzcO